MIALDGIPEICPDYEENCGKCQFCLGMREGLAVRKHDATVGRFVVRGIVLFSAGTLAGMILWVIFHYGVCL